MIDKCPKCGLDLIYADRRVFCKESGNGDWTICHFIWYPEHNDLQYFPAEGSYGLFSTSSGVLRLTISDEVLPMLLIGSEATLENIINIIDQSIEAKIFL
jgi:hypothetical protein